MGTCISANNEERKPTINNIPIRPITSYQYDSTTPVFPSTPVHVQTPIHNPTFQIEEYTSPPQTQYDTNPQAHYHFDYNQNGVPDCHQDLNNNGIPDCYEDLNNNGIPDYLENH